MKNYQNSQSPQTNTATRVEKILPLALSRVFAEAEKKVHNGYFTAWSAANGRSSLSVFYADEFCPHEDLFSKSIPHFHPVFDLASLTKPLLTNLSLRAFRQDYHSLIQHPLSSLFQMHGHHDRVAHRLNDFFQKNSHLTLNNFLSHSSGALPWFWMQRDKLLLQRHKKSEMDFFNEKRELLTEICLNKMTDNFETKYSDINYFLMTRLLESLNLFTDIHINDEKETFRQFYFWKSLLNKLNEKFNSHFFHASLNPHLANHAIPYYPYVIFSGSKSDKWVHGVFEDFGANYDTNANILSSQPTPHLNLVSGHSGLFGSCIDVKNTLLFLAQTQYPEFSNKIYDTSHRFYCGLDQAQNDDSTAGIGSDEYNSLSTHTFYGHLGYSGTSFWIKQNLQTHDKSFGIFLCNRTAARKKLSPTPHSRVMLFTEHLSNNLDLHHYYLIKNNDEAIALTKDDFQETLWEQRNNYVRIWDKNSINKLHDIKKLRQNIHSYLWEI